MTTPQPDAAQVPLVKLLRGVPRDYILKINGDGPFPSLTSIPVGRHCHDAANELDKALAELTTLRAANLAAQKLIDEARAKRDDANDTIKKVYAALCKAGDTPIETKELSELDHAIIYAIYMLGSHIGAGEKT